MLPGTFVDVSTMREIPDTQECWVDAGACVSESDASSRISGCMQIHVKHIYSYPKSSPYDFPGSSDRSIIIEILGLEDTVANKDCSKFYWDDLCQTNEASQVILHGVIWPECQIAILNYLLIELVMGSPPSPSLSLSLSLAFCAKKTRVFPQCIGDTHNTCARTLTESGG